MGGQAHDRPLREPRQFGSERPNPESGVDQKIARAASNVPYIALNELINLGLEDQRDIVTERFHLKPGCSDIDGVIHE